MREVLRLESSHHECVAESGCAYYHGASVLPLQLVVNPVSGNGRGLAHARGLERRLRAEGYDARTRVFRDSLAIVAVLVDFLLHHPGRWRHVRRLRGAHVSVTASGEPAEVLRMLPSALPVLVPGPQGR